MQINKSFETPEGTVTFEGTIEGPELDYVLQLGLLAIMQQGMVNTFYAVPTDEDTIQ